MTFDEAVELASRIRQTPSWYVLDITPAPGQRLEDQAWAVRAVSNLKWDEFWYWDTNNGIITEWPRFATAFAQGVAQRDRRNVTVTEKRPLLPDLDALPAPVDEADVLAHPEEWQGIFEVRTDSNGTRYVVHAPPTPKQ